MYLDGLSYAREHLTDGFLPDAYVRRSPLVSHPEVVANALASRAVRLWHRTKGGYRIHDYHDWNRKAADVKEKREKKRREKAAERERKKAGLDPVSAGVSPGDTLATSRARASTIHGTPDLSSTSGVEIERREPVVPKRRSAAAPPSRSPVTLFPSPLSTEPAKDGNYAVIERIAHEVFDELGAHEPTSDVVERVKGLCAQRRIDYGRHPDVAANVVLMAVKSAATQRALVPVRSSAGRDEFSSLGELAAKFRAQLDARRRVADGH